MNNIDDDKAVKGADLVKWVFGYWPAFHDAEICDMQIKRNLPGEEMDMVIAIHHWGQDNPNFSGLRRDCIIDFLFKSITKGTLEICSLPDPGWIDEISFKKNSNINVVDVDIKPLSGLDLRLTCQSVEIIGIRNFPT